MEEACWEKKGEEVYRTHLVQGAAHYYMEEACWEKKGEEVYRTHLVQGAAHYYMEEACREKKKGGRSLSNPPCTGSGPLLHGRGLLGEEGGRSLWNPPCTGSGPLLHGRGLLGEGEGGEEVYGTHLAQGAAHYYMEEACREKKKGEEVYRTHLAQGAAHYYMEEACREKKKGGRSLSNPPCTGSGPLLHGRGLLGEEGGKKSMEPTLHRERPITTWKRPVGRRRGEEVYGTHLVQGAAHYYMEEACWEKEGGRSLSNPPCTGSGPLLHGRGL